MKKIIILLVVVFFTAAEAKIITAGGDLVKKEISASSFDRLDVRTQIDVYLSQGGQEKAYIESYENILSWVESEEKNMELMVRLDRRVTRINWLGRPKILKLYITVKDLKRLDLSGACDLYMQTPFQVADFNLNASGASDLHMQPVKGEDIRIYCSGASDISNAVFDLHSFYLNTSGSSDAEISMKAVSAEFITSGASDIDLEINCRKLKINASGASDFGIYGECDELKASISGASSLLAENLRTRIADIDVSGNSECRVYASESLKAGSSGTSSIYYRGNPPKTSFSVSGLSSIKSQ